MRLSSFFFFLSSFLLADNLSHTLSNQGFTGLINTPNAQVIREGTAMFHYNNQFDNHLRNYNYNSPSVSQDDYIAGIGFLSGMEIVGRLNEVASFTKARQENVGFEIRDLGVNAKYQLPYKHKYLPNIAFGFQDLGSQSSYFANTYIVMDKELGIFRGSLGYGKSGDNKAGKRMDGMFAGLEAKITNWASALVEHDGVENHAALRFNLPSTWTNGLQLNATIAQNLTQAQSSFAINLAVPLFHNSKNIELIEKKDSPHIIYPYKKHSIVKNTLNKLPIMESKTKKSFLNIQNRLVHLGFENVQVGHYQKSIYIKCENSIFDQTDIDALGVIVESIVKYRSTNQHYIITLVKNNIQTLSMSGEIQIFKNYLKKANIENKKALKENLHFSRTFDEKNVIFISSVKNSSFLKPRLELSPGLVSTIGTEVGVFDYILALRANAYTTLYNGLTLSAMYEIPLIQSQNFDQGKPLANLYSEKLKNRLVNAQIHQTLNYESLLNTTSLGQFRDNTYGLLNHTNLTTTSGQHGINLRVGKFKEKDSTKADRSVYVGSYRYFYAPLDLFSEISYGQYWDQDKGGSLQFKRFFGETSIALYYKHTEKSFIGFNLSIPLTGRKSYNSKWGQIKGKKDFNYGVRTVVQSASNNLTPSNVIIPKTDLELTTHYLDRDRLNSSYIKNHVDRMRDAALTYSNN